MEAAEILSKTVDKSQVPPLHQKRLLAFINHFLVSTCSFLNDFATNCETKFIELERKLQKIEAALIILEAKLASIPDVADKTATVETTSEQNAIETTEKQSDVIAATNVAAVTTEQTQPDRIEVQEDSTPVGVRACDDVRYKKFFKMVQFGVPAAAVKMKMQAEGFEASILDSPNCILEDGVSSS